MEKNAMPVGMLAGEKYGMFIAYLEERIELPRKSICDCRHLSV